MKKFFSFIISHKLESFIFIIIIAISAAAHGINMFNFPYYENDEGTYLAQAWSLLNNGQLAPYTYWYDHAPAGWIFIALWEIVSGGFNTFGFSVNSGRVFMLLLHIASCILLYYIARRLTKRPYAGILAVLIFSLSPLGIYFQRRILLDNIMIFWALLSWALLLKQKVKLRHIMASAVTFAIAVLTKENAIFFTPGLLYMLFLVAHKKHRHFAFITWITISAAIISLYPLYALLKGEFFPVGFMGDMTPHVSLVSTWMDQLGRGSTLPFWNRASDFYVNLQEWIARDPYTIFGGMFATFFCSLFAIKNRAFRTVTLFTACFWLFLVRGKLVIDFYMVPILPLLTLCIGMVGDTFLYYLSFKNRYVHAFLIFLAAIGISSLLFIHNIGQWTKNETQPQKAAVAWLLTNAPKNAVIAIDEYADIEFRKAGYTNAFWFWKMWNDPAVQKKFNNDWRNINYILLTHEELKQIGNNIHAPYDPVRIALLNSTQVELYGPTDKDTYLNIPQYKSTNGNWAAVYQLKSPNQIILDSSWTYYKKQFIHSYGQVVDPSNNVTTSEGQSYAMLRAVFEHDQKTFDGVWQWTQDHMQYRKQDKLFSWLWEKSGSSYKIADSASATDADEDIALSLLLAYGQWGNPAYLDAAKPIIADIWKKEVVTINGRHYVISGSDAQRKNGYLVNPSYLSPAIYRTFVLVDPTHPWNQVAKDSYGLLNKLASQTNNKTSLPPNWIYLTNRGDITSAKQYIKDPTIDMYGFDAFRTMWRVALDVRWYKNSDAIAYLKKVSPFFTTQWNNNKSFEAIYDLQGIKKVTYSNISTDAGALAVFSVTNKQLAQQVYTKLFANQFNFSNGYWGNGSNYYDQNWAWFATQLYYGM